MGLSFADAWVRSTGLCKPIKPPILSNILVITAPLLTNTLLPTPIILVPLGVTCAWHRFILNLLAGIEAIEIEAPRDAADAMGAEILEVEAGEMAGGLLADGDPDLGGLGREHAGGLLHALGDVHGAADGGVVDPTGRADIADKQRAGVKADAHCDAGQAQGGALAVLALDPLGH